MADVQRYGVRPRTPRLEHLMRTVESTCRSYDNGITKCAWALAVLIVWFVVAGTLVRVDEIVYDGGITQQMSMPVVTSDRAKMRVLHRVLGIMSEQCLKIDQDLVIGQQVHVNQKPYLFRVLHICGEHELINPVVAVSESTTGTCVDEYDGDVRRVLRRYPLTVHSDNNPPVSYMNLQSVCTLMQAIDLLDGKW